MLLSENGVSLNQGPLDHSLNQGPWTICCYWAANGLRNYNAMCEAHGYYCQRRLLLRLWELGMTEEWDAQMRIETKRLRIDISAIAFLFTLTFHNSGRMLSDSCFSYKSMACQTTIIITKWILKHVSKTALLKKPLWWDSSPRATLGIGHGNKTHSFHFAETHCFFCPCPATQLCFRL